MKFKVEYAGNRSDKKEIEINTLEELQAFAIEIGDDLVIQFNGIKSKNWYIEPNRENTIIIYDDYLE